MMAALCLSAAMVVGQTRGAGPVQPATISPAPAPSPAALTPDPRPDPETDALPAPFGVLQVGDPEPLPDTLPDSAAKPVEPPAQQPVNVNVFVPPVSAPAPAAVTKAATPADRWFVMKELQGTWPGYLLETSRVSVSGWTEGTFTASSDRFSNLPMGFNYKANQFLLQQNWLRVERAVDQTATTPTFGFRADTILPGSDYRFTVARGLFFGQLTSNNGGPELYGIDPIQFYAEAYFPQLGRGTDIKVGRFFSQYGAESNDTTQVPFVSRSYSFIYDPFTHTGILATTKLTDAWSVQNGLATGCDVFIDPVANPTYICSVKWAPPGGRDSVLVSVIICNGRFDQARQFHNPEIFDLVYTHKFSDRLNYTLDALYGFTTNANGGDGQFVGFADWWATVHYLSYQLTPRLTGNARLEFFDDVQGQRTGFAGLYVVPTVGVTFKPWRSVWLRPEVRFDYNTESRPFEDKHGLFTATSDLVVRW
jgi:hypothetical protein